MSYRGDYRDQPPEERQRRDREAALVRQKADRRLPSPPANDAATGNFALDEPPSEPPLLDLAEIEKLKPDIEKALGLELNEKQLVLLNQRLSDTRWKYFGHAAALVSELADAEENKRAHRRDQAKKAAKHLALAEALLVDYFEGFVDLFTANETPNVDGQLYRRLSQLTELQALAKVLGENKKRSSLSAFDVLISDLETLFHNLTRKWGTTKYSVELETRLATPFTEFCEAVIAWLDPKLQGENLIERIHRIHRGLAPIRKAKPSLAERFPI